MNHEEARREAKRLEDKRLRPAPEVMGGDSAAVEEDKRLERRITEPAGSEGRKTRSDLPRPDTEGLRGTA